MRGIPVLVIIALLSGNAASAEMEIEVEIPRLSVAEYHKPYVAVWIARADQSVAANLGVWYQQTDGPEGEGTTWLKDLRQWWRRTGRSLDMPIDGTTAATRGPGTHSLNFNGDASQLAGLEDGEYTLHVEAAREVGGRELLKIPFQWSQDAQELSVSGERELGTITLRLNP